MLCAEHQGAEEQKADQPSAWCMGKPVGKSSMEEGQKLTNLGVELKPGSNIIVQSTRPESNESRQTCRQTTNEHLRSKQSRHSRNKRIGGY